MDNLVLITFDTEAKAYQALSQLKELDATDAVDLHEAAVLDGYGHLRFMTRVAVPLARPSLAALGVFSFLAAWNQYLWPLVSTGGTTPLDTVQIGLKQLLGTQVSQIPVSLAGAVIAFVPLVILLLVFQKQLVRSLTAGAVK